MLGVKPHGEGDTWPGRVHPCCPLESPACHLPSDTCSPLRLPKAASTAFFMVFGRAGSATRNLGPLCLADLLSSAACHGQAMEHPLREQEP